MNLEKSVFKIFGVLVLVLFISSCETEKPRTPDNIFEFVAPNPALIIKVKDYEELKIRLDNQSFLKKNNSSKLLSLLNLNSWNDVLEIPKNTLVTYHSLSKNEVVETLIFKSKDSLKLKINSTEKTQYDGMDIFSVKNEKQRIYYSNIAGYTVMSSSKIILDNIIRNFKNKITISESISKLSAVLSDKSSSIIINTTLINSLSKSVFTDLEFLPFLEMTDYIAFDLIIDEHDLFLSGVILEGEQTSMPWANFSDVNPQESIVAEVVPNSFINLQSVLVNNYNVLFDVEENVNQNQKIDSLWLGASEVAKVNFASSSATLLVSHTIDETNKYLNNRSKPLKSFGTFEIFQITEKLNDDENMSKLLSNINFEYYAIIKDIIVGSNTLQTIEDIIIEINNTNTLSLQPSFNYHFENLNANSHILWFTNLEKSGNIVEKSLTDDYQKDYKKIDWSIHDFLVSQMRVEEGFAYFNVLQRERKPESSYSKVEQLVRITPKSSVVSQPQFFKNWRTGQRDVVYQDSNNVLHLRDTKGNLIWSKPLESPIIGDITTIDIYQNKRLQLAFVTQNKLYILDKNGKEVSPFPLKSKTEITQELSVFDYDKNGKYRFLIITGEKVSMYDKQAKKVKGFKYKKAKSPIKYPLKHIRMNGKDYILVQDDDGKLEILDRRGKTRVKLSNNFKHNGGEWFKYQGKFVSLNDEGKLVLIDAKGGMDIKNYDWINPKFVADSKTLVTMSENTLSIGKNNAKLPYGLYSTPLTTSKYVAISDRQDQKVYILDKTGKIIQGFPVYGKEIVDLYYTEKTIVLLVLDEKGAIMVYKANLS